MAGNGNSNINCSYSYALGGGGSGGDYGRMGVLGFESYIARACRRKVLKEGGSLLLDARDKWGMLTFVLQRHWLLIQLL